ncbi:MAG: hypothetical protein JST75_09540 [Bacteroidetes bacterium]|nr:hypothetical protein [Bacteroidota bacterium]
MGMKAVCSTFKGSDPSGITVIEINPSQTRSKALQIQHLRGFLFPAHIKKQQRISNSWFVIRAYFPYRNNVRPNSSQMQSQEGVQRMNILF